MSNHRRIQRKIELCISPPRHKLFPKTSFVKKNKFVETEVVKRENATIHQAESPANEIGIKNGIQLSPKRDRK